MSLTLSDSFCVDRHREDFLDLVGRQVDVLFANEDEIMALYEEVTFDDALEPVRRHCEVAALTRRQGGLGGRRRRRVVHVIDAHPCAEVVDTTGAGDLYAAGFLYGLTHGRSLADCGRLGVDGRRRGDQPRRRPSARARLSDRLVS